MLESTPLLKVRRLSKRFGDFQALENVGFEIFPNEILGLIHLVLPLACLLGAWINCREALRRTT